MKGSGTKILVLIVVAAALAIVAWLLRDEIFPVVEEAVRVRPEPSSEVNAAPSGPLHALAPLASQGPENHDLIPLPALDDSDSYFLLALIDTFGRDIEVVLVRESLIDKFVATVDNLPRDHVAEKIRPVGKLAAVFVADITDQDDAFFLGSENFARYDPLVALIAATDRETIVTTYRRFYPLLQESYERLGYPNGYFNDRVVEVIDHLVATPTPDGPVRLVRPHVLYEFADPELQSLSSGQKLLLRIGNEHAATIKQTLQSLRTLII